MNIRPVMWTFFVFFLTDIAGARPPCEQPHFKRIPMGIEGTSTQAEHLPKVLDVGDGWQDHDARLVALPVGSVASKLMGSEVVFMRSCTDVREGDIAPECHLNLLLINRPKAGGPEVVKSVSLASGQAARGEHMYRVHQLSLVDVDGDSEVEIVAKWSVEGESLPSSGHQTDTFYGVFHRESLAQLWSGRIEATGSGDLNNCTSQLTRADVNCDGRYDLRFVTDCTRAVCRDAKIEHCPKPIIETSIFQWDESRETWRKMPAKPPID